MSHTGSIQGTNWTNLRSDEVSWNDSQESLAREPELNNPEEGVL
jgi:hypothetical protein